MQRAKRMFQNPEKESATTPIPFHSRRESPPFSGCVSGLPGKSFFLSFLFPGWCSTGCLSDTPPGRRSHIFGGRSHMSLSSGSPVPVLTSPFIGPFLRRCRRNCYRRQCCRLSRGSFVNGMIPGAHSKSKATMESEGKP